MSLVPQEAFKLSDLRSPLFWEQRSFIDDCQHHRNYKRQPESVKQINEEFLRITWVLGISGAFECLPNIVAHDVEPEDAKQNADVHHVAGEFTEPRNLHDENIHSIENQESVKQDETEDVTHQTLPVIGFELLKLPKHKQCDNQKRE